MDNGQMKYCTLSLIMVVLILVMPPTGHAQSRAKVLRGALSPNKRYSVIVSQKTYTIIDEKYGKSLASFPCTYGPELWPGVEDSTEVFWNSESRLCMIDEASMHFMGELFLFRINNKKVIPIAFRMENIISLLPKKLERSRIRVNKGWIHNNTINMEISGPTKTNNFFQSFDVVIDPEGNTSVILSKSKPAA